MIRSHYKPYNQVSFSKKMSNIQSFSISLAILFMALTHTIVQCQHPGRHYHRHSNIYRNGTRGLRLKRSDFSHVINQGLITQRKFEPASSKRILDEHPWFYLLMKIDKDCIYRGYAGPAIYVQSGTHFIASIFNMEESAWDPCKNDPNFNSGVNIVWEEEAKDVMNFTKYLNEKASGTIQPRDKVRYRGRLGVTELGLYRYVYKPSKVLEVLNGEREEYHVVFANDSNYVIRDCHALTYLEYPNNESKLSLVPVVISLSLGYGEFNIGWYISEQKFSRTEQSGTPIFCNGHKLTFFVAPDDKKEFSNRFRVIHVKHIKPSLDYFFSLP